MAGRGEATDACRVSRAPGDGGRSGCEQSEAETSWVRAPYAGQVTSFMMFHIHSLEARIESEMLAHHLPGFALAVVRGNEVWYARGFGVTSVEDAGLPVTPQTLFCIGSISKSLTALTVARLADEGWLDLDVPVTEYIPWLTFSKPEFSSGITLRRLLSHSAGLFGTAGNIGPRDPNGLETFIRESIPSASFVAEPGTVFEYSNVGVDLAGYVAEVVAGQYFPEVVQDHLLGPLHMQRTTYDRTIAMTYPVALPHVTAVNGSTAVQHRMFEYAAANPAGQAMSTVLDLAQVGIMLLNQGRFDGEHVLRPESVVEILRPQISLRDVEGSGYGLGFWTLKYKSLDWVTHGGFLTPYLCEFSIFPQAGIGVMFACNATTDFNPYSIRSEIVDQLLDMPKNWMAPKPPPATPDEGILARHAGTYVSLAAGFATIAVTDGSLTLERPGNTVALHAVDDYRFTSADGTVSVGFVPQAAGPSQYFMFDEHAYRRLDRDASPQVPRSVLESYVGAYLFDDGDTVTMRLKDDRLHASFSWLPGEHDCIALDDTHFAPGPGVIEFRQRQDGEFFLLYLGFVTARRILDPMQA